MTRIMKINQEVAGWDEMANALRPNIKVFDLGMNSTHIAADLRCERPMTALTDVEKWTGKGDADPSILKQAQLERDF